MYSDIVYERLWKTAVSLFFYIVVFYASKWMNLRGPQSFGIYEISIFIISLFIGWVAVDILKYKYEFFRKWF